MHPNSKPWTRAEIDRLVELYPTGGYPALRKAFPDRSELSLRNKIQRLALRRSGYKHWEKITSCPEWDARIQRAYAQPRSAALRNLAEALGVEYGWLKWRATQLGLVRSPQQWGWGPEEDAILQESIAWGLKKTKARLAAHGFIRSLGAIADRKLLLGLRDSGQPPGVLSRPELARLMGVQPSTVERWIKGGLPSFRDSPLTPVNSQSWNIYIREQDFKQWLRQHPTRVDLRKIQGQAWFLELCLGSPKTE